MEDKENNREFIDDLKNHNDPVENWPVAKLKKEANGGSDMGQSQEIGGPEIY